eukprot:CAMPEP_0114630518 /NCGR_PEP_ID=MMETSP0168-20121206/13926_1 /TAXON_ID=95228 ORGANISM="Vannella sp., Strain DIVA3 517/6/12" /NCGR_SAMPLE_ID=MMETSP0168 /ASSEMBLY_ACC=CAM_ASM_000044 /LENGTH=230 /DNA_ID=CAMNT_0001842031 /DNA_START=37 /DNA_END=726 /DNA_ORIENTATION=-
MASYRAAVLLFAALVACALLADSVSAHARLNNPAPRSTSDNLTNGPCGGVAPGTGNRATLEPGTRTIRFDATIPHAGTFRIAIATSPDDNFDDIVLVNDIEADGDQIEFSVELEIPDIDCPQCALQMVQQANIGPDYYSCADIEITGSIDPDDYDHENPSSDFSLWGLLVTAGLVLAGIAVIVIVVSVIVVAVIAFKNPDKIRGMMGRGSAPTETPYVRYEDGGINLDAA